MYGWSSRKGKMKQLNEALVTLIESKMDIEDIARFIADTDIPPEHCAQISTAWVGRWGGAPDFLGVPSALDAKMQAQRTKEVPFLDIPIGGKFWNAGGPQFGVLFEKTGEKECVSLSGHMKGEVFRGCSPSSLEHMVIEG